MKTNFQKFQTDGFLILEDFNTNDECNTLKKRGKELANNFDFNGHASIFQTSDQVKTSDEYFLESGSNISCFFEKDAFDKNGKLKRDLFLSLNKIGHALHDIDPIFNSFSRSVQMKKLVNELMLHSHVIIQSMLIFKHARIGGNVDIHQDSTFLYTEPDSCIGFWFALEDATIENGCLWAKPGGQNTSLRSRFKCKNKNETEFITLDKEPLSMDNMIPLEVKKGTCIVLHGLLPHYSLPNTSGQSRQAYSIHMISNRAIYPNNNWLQREMKELKGV